MKIIDNVSDTLGNDLKQEILPGSKLRVAAATFSIYAFEALQKELEQISQLQFIFTAPAFVPTTATDRIARERRQFFIPALGHGESSLYGSEFEIRLRNKLTQRAIARECAEWVRRKVQFKSNSTGNPMQQFAAVDDQTAYMPLQGFTTADLGLEPGNAVSNAVPKFEGRGETAQWLAIFDAIWHNPDQVKDVTDAVADHIATVYAENSPARIYFLMLYHIFREFLGEVSEDDLPNERTGYRESGIWQALYQFQRDAALGIIQKLEKYNGCILADSVGLGKTFTALAVIKYYELRNKSVLVLTPKKLAENWTNYVRNYTTNIFAKDRFNYDVLAHTDLSRTKGQSLGTDLAKVNWSNYDLLVIDESHNFRNADYAEEKESRYQRLMRQVIREGVKTKVLMLSATPVNNRFNDLKNQLRLAYEGESENLSKHLNLSTTVEKVFADAQHVFNEWSKLDPAERTSERILQMLDFDFFELLDAVTIARSRKHITAFYDTTEIGTFPDRLRPIAIREPLTDLRTVPTFNEIFGQLQELTLAVYTPMAFVFPSRRAAYDELFAVTADDDTQLGIGQSGREQGLKKLMTVNLLKRLESSVEAFRLTLGRIQTAIERTIRRLDDYEAGKRAEAAGLVGVEGASIDVDTSGFESDDFDDDDAEEAEALKLSAKTPINLADIDIPSWRRDLADDHETLRELIIAMDSVTPEHDRKLQRITQMIRDKAANPINPGNRKVLLFSAFADTAEYLYRNLAPSLQAVGLQTALVTGGGHNAKTTIGKGYDFQQALTLFSPVSKQRSLTMPRATGEIDVLIGTDVISEGQNLQDCDYIVNYDIHWNPVRIIQRFGRIDRIGSTNSKIQLVNFWPDISLDEYLSLKERVENRMVIADLAATADDNPLTGRASDAAFRTEQLRRLQDEVVELEETNTGVAITDLGLNDFRMDLLAYLKEDGDIATAPKGMHAVVPANPAIGLGPGVIFALRDITAERPGRSTPGAAGAAGSRGNRLHPYYLVYVADDGSVIADHTRVKHLLDLIRSGCRPYSEPVPDVTKFFNAATRDGAEMSRYSVLLTDAITSMTQVTDERDIASLFTPGATTALTQAVGGLDEFELIAFLVIVDPGAAGTAGTVAPEGLADSFGPNFG